MPEKPKVIGVLGGGQLGRMLIEAANRSNVKVNVLDADNAPAKQISNHEGHVAGAFSDADRVYELAKTSDVLTVEIEHINTQALEDVSKSVLVEPPWQTLRLIQNKYDQKVHLKRHLIAISEFAEVKEDPSKDLAAIGRAFGYPMMVKSKTLAYDGRGNYALKAEEDIPAALEALKDRPLYVERWVPFKGELAVIVVKTKDGTLSYPTVETVHEDSICKLVYAPARFITREQDSKAQALARKAISTFEGKGVFAVEMFVDGKDQLLVNEIAPRPHNSGHYTIEACPVSQYEAHLRAITDLPIPERSLRLREPAIMVNILGGAEKDSHLEVGDFSRNIPDASLHLYGKGDARPGRKMGHVTITCATMAEAEETAQPLIDLVDQIRARRLGITPPQSSPDSSPKAAPQVAVIMGSDSDGPVLEGGVKILERLSIPYEPRVTSAHRTPEWMAEFASQAASRGIKVIIAAAGGAAHLPGMGAAHTVLPVIGVPVKASVLDGMDSLMSIVQMPRGVPVATVGINNSVNAALLAARIIGLQDARVRAEVERYASEARDESLAKDQRLSQAGWQTYFAKG